MWNLKQHRSRYSKDVLSYLIINRSIIYQIKFHIFIIKKLILKDKIRNDQIKSLKEFNKKILIISIIHYLLKELFLRCGEYSKAVRTGPILLKITNNLFNSTKSLGMIW